MKSIFRYISILIIFLLASCNENIIETEETAGSGNSTVDIDIPEGFNYNTHRKVTIKINDNSAAFYEVFSTSDEKIFEGTVTYENEAGETVTEDFYRDDIIRKKLFKGIPQNGILEQTVTLPNYCTEVYIRRNDNLKLSGELISIVNKEVNYTYQQTAQRNASFQSKSSTLDVFYAVNGQGDLFQINPLDGSYALLSQMPHGSYTAAIDEENLIIYSIGRSSPHPLMKFDIQTEIWSTVADLGFSGPRLDYNPVDGLLYFSRRDRLRSIDPLTGVVLNQWAINGIDNFQGGDIKFAEDGTLYLASFSGLYRCDYNGSSYDAVKISPENLPFTPTSITIDSNGDVWLADNQSDGSLIVMDPTSGGWQYYYGANANNGSSFGRRINDLTTLTLTSGPTQPDSDGDGVPDSEDEFPQDPDRAFSLYIPNNSSLSTLAFEDLWPYFGDYDFNDVVLSYQMQAALNAENNVVQLDIICKLKDNGAGFKNAIGIELEGISPGQITSVDGSIYTEDFISLNANGTEANQQNAVIILSDNVDNLINETKISIYFNTPLSTADLGEAPFNPFIIQRLKREHEIHLPYKNATSLAQDLGIVTGHVNDPNNNYLSETGLPWAISIADDFDVPKERMRIYDAYHYFIDWAISGGEQYGNWYKDIPGYRNVDLIDQ
jgi:LruC domain-containing protein